MILEAHLGGTSQAMKNGIFSRSIFPSSKKDHEIS